MSLNVKTIILGDTEVTLRLTSKALLNYNLKHGSKSATPLVAVLDSLTNYNARIDLLTNALQYPESKNSVKDGAQLLDLLADNGYKREEVNQLILELCNESGLIGDDDYLGLTQAVETSGVRMIGTLTDLLTGRPVGDADAAEAAEEDENPT